MKNILCKEFLRISKKFLETIAGKSAKDAWLLMDELIEALTVLNPRLINNFYEKLNNL